MNLLGLLSLLAMFLPFIGLTWDGGGEGGGGGNSGGGEGGAGNGGGTPNPEVKYTQADVDRMTKLVEDRLSRKSHAEVKALQEKLAALQSGEGLPDEFRNQIDELQRSLMTKEEQAKAEKEIATKKLTEAEKKALEAQTELTNYIVDSQLMSAAIPKASGKDPSATAKLIVSVLKESAKLDPATKAVTVEMEVEEAGVKIKKSLSPADAVAALEQRVDQYGSLFKASAQSGFGGSNNGQGGQGNGLNFKGMGWEEFNKLCGDRPDLVGLPNDSAFGMK